MPTQGVGHSPPSPSRLGNFGEQVRGNRASLDTVRLFFIFVIYAAVIYGLFIVHHDLSSKARVTLIADFGLAGFAFMLLGELQRSGDDTLNWSSVPVQSGKSGFPSTNSPIEVGWSSTVTRRTAEVTSTTFSVGRTGLTSSKLRATAFAGATCARPR